MTQVRVTAASHPGQVRTTNQDQLVMSNMMSNGNFVKPTQITFTGPELVGVIDGMGGHAAGEVAARIAASTFASCRAAPSSCDAVTNLINAANTAIYEQMTHQIDQSGMGATCAIAVLTKDTWIIGHVGDARIYSIADEHAVLLTTDDRLRSGALSQSLGGLTKTTPVKAHVEMHEVAKHPRLLMCTDGVTDMLSLSSIQDLVKETDDLQVIESLVQACLEKGAEDNLTLALLTPIL